MATDEREDQSSEEALVNQDGTDSDFEEKNTRTNEREVGSSVKEVTYSSDMLLRGFHMSPDRRHFPQSGTNLVGPKNIAETYVTRSMVDRYGPIVSPTVSPTRPYETSTSTISLINECDIDFKTSRDYEAAASICSMRDSVNTLDAMRVSMISKLFKPSPSSIANEYGTSPTMRDSQRTNHHAGEIDPNFARVSYQNPDYASKESSNQSGSAREDTDNSDGENEDTSLIIRPREPNNETHDAPGYGCRLPCCSRYAYRNSSPESGTYSPIRIPARRPGRYPASSPTHSYNECEQSNGFGRYQNGNKSAFTAVSPGSKRHEAASSYSNMPSVKVRVIQECSSESEKLSNGHPDSIATSKRMPVENGVGPKAPFEAVGLLESGEKRMILSRGQFQTANVSKSEDFSFIKSALKKEASCKVENEENQISESKTLMSDVVSPRPTSSYLNGITFTTTVNGYNFAYNRKRPDKLPNGTILQCSTVDSTASEADSRLLDLARVANEQLGEELAKQQPVSKRVKQKSNDCLHLWEFLRDILNNESMSPRAIEWTVKERGEFRLIKTGVVAQLWGMSKNRTSMTYEKMARAMRYYYKMKILEKVPHKRLHFRFGKHMLPKVLVLPNGKTD